MGAQEYTYHTLVLPLYFIALTDLHVIVFRIMAKPVSETFLPRIRQE